MTESPTPTAPPRAILIIRPSALGDVCRSVPVLVSLRRAFPAARIDWVVQDSFLPAVAAHPDLSEAIPFPRARFGRAWRSLSAAQDLFRWLRDIRRRRYDVVYDCQGLFRSGAVTLASAAPRRVGFADAREFAHLAYNVRLKAPASAHAVDRMLALLEADGIPPVRDLRLHTPPDDSAWWFAERAARAIHDRPYAVLAPTSRWISKRWPADRFADLIDPLVERGFQYVVIVGGADERDQCQPITTLRRHDPRVVDLVGNTSVGGLMAVIEKAGVVIANDSAALHMAVGFDRPYLALFGPTNPALVGPYGGDQWVLRQTRDSQSLDHKDDSLNTSIMARISVRDVLGNLDRRLSETPRPGATFTSTSLPASRIHTQDSQAHPFASSR